MDELTGKRENLGRNTLGISFEHVTGAAMVLLGDDDYAIVFREGKLEIHWPDRADDAKTPFHGMMMGACVRVLSDPMLLLITIEDMNREIDEMVKERDET